MIMMNKMKKAFLILVSFILVFSCKEDDEYNFDKIDPGKQTISGPVSVYGNGYTSNAYVAIPRGGSTYKWEVVSGPAYLILDSFNHSFIVNLLAKSLKDTTIRLKVTETTQGGLTGEPYQMDISVEAYCNFTINSFIGSFNSKSTDYERLDRSKYPNYGPLTYQARVSFKEGNLATINNLLDSYPVNLIFSGDSTESIKMLDYIEIIDQGNGNIDTLKIKGSGNYHACKQYIALDYSIYIQNDTSRYIDTFRRE